MPMIDLINTDTTNTDRYLTCESIWKWYLLIVKVSGEDEGQSHDDRRCGISVGVVKESEVIDDQIDVQVT